MEYSYFGRAKTKVSRFGLGTMRLPSCDNHPMSPNIDKPKAIEMIRYALDNGVNYIDTAYMYHGGNSETVVGEALKDGYREKAVLATKLPVWEAKEKGDLEKIFETQLNRLQTDYVDFYLLHSLTESNWEKVLEYDAIALLEKLKAQGRIKNICFSFHDKLPVFKKIIDAYDWDMAQIQLNIVDQEYQAGIEGMEYAADKGISVVVMEPLQGGNLVNIPQSVKDIYAGYSKDRTPQEWAFRFLCNFPQVTSVLSGSSSLEQLKQSIEIFDNAKINSLSDAEIKTIDDARNEILNLRKNNCTSCSYCVPCPQNINIPDIFKTYNQCGVFFDENKAKEKYKQQEVKADKCVECGACESVCPQHISIIEDLKKADELFA